VKTVFVRSLGILIVFTLGLAGCSSSVSANSAGSKKLHILDGNILLSNDDGWRGPGLVALQNVLVADGYKVVVIAPENNESGSSVSLTTTGDLKVTQPSADKNIYAVDGTPADSMMVGLTGILSSPPSLVISGINPGYNVGDDLNYSGTVGAAVVGTLYGVPSIAVSASTPAVGTDATKEYHSVATFIVSLLRKLNGAPTSAWPKRTVLNINYPYADSGTVPSGVKLTTVANQRALKAEYQKSADGSYSLTYVPDGTAAAGTDIATVDSGYISVSAFSADRGDAAPNTNKIASLINSITP
jgi:5'-nucleotidase